MHQLWAQGNYQAITRTAKQYRKTCGGSFELDYIIATSLARVEGSKEEGSQYFRWILQNYRNQDARSLQTIREEERRVRSNPAVRPLQIQFKPIIQRSIGVTLQGMPEPIERPTNAQILAIPRFLSSGSSLEGLGLAFVQPSSGWDDWRIVEAEVSRGKNNIPVNELSIHVFNLGEMHLAIKDARKRLGPTFTIQAVGHFLLASSDTATSGQLRQAGKLMEEFYRVLPSEFKSREQHQIITVYLLSPESFEEHVDKRHQLDFGESRVTSYSIVEDLSINVNMPARVRQDFRQPAFPKRYLHVNTLNGVLIFELFRLVLALNSGDIPEWFHQGLSGFAYDSGMVKRLPDSAQFMKRFQWTVQSPSLIKLLSPPDKSEEGFEKYFTTKDRAAFIAYLNYKNLLTKAYSEFRTGVPGRLPKEDFVLSKKVIESLFKKSLSEVESDFSNWLKQYQKEAVQPKLIESQ